VGQIVGDANVQKQVKMLIAAKFPDAAKMDIADYMSKNKLTQIPVFPKQGGGYVILGTKGQYPMEQ
jgi:ribosomal protein L30E